MNKVEYVVQYRRYKEMNWTDYPGLFPYACCSSARMSAHDERVRRNNPALEFRIIMRVTHEYDVL